MQFSEYKSSSYWQAQRNRAAQACSNKINAANALAIAVLFAIFPFAYTLASFLDG